ncbi:hypothetical protein BASA81_001388 [Batrachochytrium salamandrivorans]|nr:hypothetical protein BASA81_001388 [Batrachochytrium salamandrivorans]
MSRSKRVRALSPEEERDEEEEREEVALGRYKKCYPIGQGAYAYVYFAKDLENNNSPVVLKVVMSKPREEDGVSTSSWREISVLKALVHSPHVVKLMDVGTKPFRKITLVLESMECDLAKYIASNRLAPHTVRYIIRQVLLGAQAVHTLWYFHRDLKPSNILINCSSLETKLADFGLACEYTPNRKNTLLVGTLPYRSPDVWMGNKQYTRAIDMWAVGCIFGEMHTRRPLFLGTNWGAEEDVPPTLCGNLRKYGHWIDQLTAVFAKLGTPKTIEGCAMYCSELFPQWPHPCRKNLLAPGCEPLAFDLMRRMLAINFSERITAKQALEHEYFKGT